MHAGTGGPTGQEEEGGEGGRPRRRWGRHATVAAENTQLYLLAPKTDVHGLGFDPFKVGGGSPVGFRGQPVWVGLCPRS